MRSGIVDRCLLPRGRRGPLTLPSNRMGKFSPTKKPTTASMPTRPWVIWARTSVPLCEPGVREKRATRALYLRLTPATNLIVRCLLGEAERVELPWEVCYAGQVGGNCRGERASGTISTGCPATALWVDDVHALRTFARGAARAVHRCIFDGCTSARGRRAAANMVSHVWCRCAAALSEGAPKAGCAF